MTEPDSEIVIRAYRSGDEVEINAGFNAVFGTARSLEEWRWKFPDQPWGRYIVIAVAPSGRVLAHYGAVAMQFQFGGERVCAGQIVDAYSREEVRGTRVFSNCYERFIASYGNPQNLPLMFGFPGRRHYDMGLKALKYIPISSVPFWARKAHRWRRPASWRHRLREGFDADAADSLWRTAGARYEVAAARDASWLGARYGGRPGVTYRHLSVWHRGSPQAWAVVRCDGETLRCADLVWNGDDARTLEALDVALDHVAVRSGCTRLELWLGGDAAAERALERCGWSRQPCPHDLLMVARAFHPLVDLERMRGQLYLTMGDSDLV